jgi:hypothetical protein
MFDEDGKHTQQHTTRELGNIFGALVIRYHQPHFQRSRMADWSSVFEETGEEDGDWDRNEVEESRISILKYFQNYNPLVAYFFTVNYVLGVGCLGIPYAFQKSGLVLASACVIIVSSVSYMTVMFIAEVSHRGLHARRLSTNPFVSIKPQRKPSNGNLISAQSSSGKQQQELPVNQTTQQGYKYQSITLGSASTKLTTASRNPLKSTSRPRLDSSDSVGEGESENGEMEVTELAGEYLGTFGKGRHWLLIFRICSCSEAFHHVVSYQLALSMLTMVGLLAYAQVFNSSFRVQVWPTSPDWFPLVLFAVIVVPLSCIDLGAYALYSPGRHMFTVHFYAVEQISVQVVMSVFRFLSLGILFFGTLAAVWLVPVDRDVARVDTNKSLAGNSVRNDEVPLVEMSGFALIFTTAIFAQLFQHSVPGIIVLHASFSCVIRLCGQVSFVL